MKYIINHKIKGFTGKSACLVFSNGVSETNDSWVASWFKSKGHNVIENSLNDGETGTLEDNSMKSTLEKFKNIDKDIDSKVYDNDNSYNNKVEKVDKYNSYSLDQLKAIAKEKGVEGLSKLNKADLIQALKTLEELENE